jgi:hypothetical protein
MVLIVHIIIALSSVAYSAFVLYAPSNAKLRVSYGLIGLTVVSGTYLVLSTGAQVLQSCITGLTFVGLSLAGVAAARYRLVRMTKTD